MMGLAGVLLAVNSFAQSVDPGAIRSREQEKQEYYRFEEKLKEGKTPVPEKGQVEDRTNGETSPGPEAADRTIFVARIETNPSDILSLEEVEGITRKYEGREVSIRDLFEAVREINRLYAAKGFIAARAILPPQKVERGVIRIELVEGRIGKILIKGNEHTKESFFTNRLSLKSGDLVRVDRLERDLVFLNSTSDVETRAELGAGETPGTTDLTLKVQEPGNYQATLFSDNAGSDTVGLYRFGLMLGSSSLLGYRDRLNLNAYFTKHRGTVAGSASYNVPVGTLGTRLDLSYSYNRIKVISGPYEVLDISGESPDLGFDLNHPFIAGPAFRLNGFTGFHYSKSTTEFDGVRLYETEVRTVNAGFDIQSLDAQGFWFFSNRLTRGLHVLSGDSRFLKYNPFLLRQQTAGEDLVLVFRGSAQLTREDNLPPSEQFQIGGASSVRGYPEGYLIGDTGYLISAELFFPLPFPDAGIAGFDLRNRLKGVVFADHGGAFPYKPGGGSMTHHDYITGTGIGLTGSISKHFTGRLILGIPITNRGHLKDDCLFHFSVQTDLF